ncbi:MAG: hypothetical protein AAF621_01275 [Pseudomonadota bacterium]
MLKAFPLLAMICIMQGCGFKADTTYLEKRSAYRGDCEGLKITDRYNFTNENDGSTRRLYQIETLPNASGYNYQISHSNLSDDNFVNRVTVNKNIKDRVCQDNYLRDARLLDEAQ